MFFFAVVFWAVVVFFAGIFFAATFFAAAFFVLSFFAAAFRVVFFAVSGFFAATASFSGFFPGVQENTATPSADRLSLPTLLHYLKASHVYYIDFQLPFIRKELVEALDETDNLARIILVFSASI